MDDRDKPPIMFPINSPRLRRFEAWLWNRPKTSLALFVLSFVLISSPVWFADFWSLFSNDAPVPAIMNWIRSLPAINVSWYWVPVGLGAVMLVIMMAVFWRERKRLERELAEARAMSSPPPFENAVFLHAECQKSIGRLQESASLHSMRADTNESIFKGFKEKYASAIAVADRQAPEVGKFVEVLRVCTHDAKLDDAMPTIRWSILLKNRSVYRISLDGDVGPLFFEGHKLAEHKDLLENKVMGLYPERDGSIVFEQRLSPSEVNLLKSLPNGKFEFDKVMLYVKGSDAEHVTSDRVVIFSRFRATLGKCSDERSQAVEELLAEMAQQKSGAAARLMFEIDVQRTQMQYRGYTNNGNYTLVGALVRLRCSKEGDSKLAVREFRAELRSEGDEMVFADGALIRAYVDNNAKDSVNIEGGWTIDEPLTEFRFYDFTFEISNEALRIVGRYLFVRITMNAIGQDPQHKDFFVDSWNDAIKSASGVTLRRVG